MATSDVGEMYAFFSAPTPTGARLKYRFKKRHDREHVCHQDRESNHIARFNSRRNDQGG